MECERCPYWQPEYLWCDKVGGKHWQYGYCSDIEYNKKGYYYDYNKQNNKTYSKRKPTNKWERQYVFKLKDKRLKQIIRQGGYAPHRGYIEWDYIDGKWQETGTHIKYPTRSNTQKWIKKYTSSKIRHSKDVPLYNGYRKYVDYWWIMY